MKIILALLFVAVGNAPNLAYAFQNEPTGFRGIPWGAPVSPNLSMVEDSGNEKFYRRTDDHLAIGEATLSSISYLFYKGEFLSVMIKTESITNKQALIRAFFSQYGPLGSDTSLNRYYWKGTVGTVGISCNSITDACTALITSEIWNEKRRADRDAAAKKSSKDF